MQSRTLHTEQSIFFFIFEERLVWHRSLGIRYKKNRKSLSSHRELLHESLQELLHESLQESLQESLHESLHESLQERWVRGTGENRG